ncbi:unnamed protein product [Owenia fusiformis]|uniref:LicD/FKTN/FKRP nucleotidyltransferase domain-containing protein n=1 Tax=Owenia fusiformis TaxID=6347 RepID=A0A8J1XZ43_OWEFU|nr:unnamed protein product [Owenia fusiformis]
MSHRTIFLLLICLTLAFILWVISGSSAVSNKYYIMVSDSDGHNTDVDDVPRQANFDFRKKRHRDDNSSVWYSQCRFPKCCRQEGCTDFPQCKDLLFQLLQDAVWIMRSLGIPYQIVYGTLLGAYRNYSILPWTADVDLIVHKKHWNDLIGTHPTEDPSRRLHVAVDKRECEDDKTCHCIRACHVIKNIDTPPESYPNVYNYNAYYMDIYTYFEAGDDSIGLCDRYYHKDWLFPPRNYTINGKSFLGPNKGNVSLQITYGLNFMHPIEGL